MTLWMREWIFRLWRWCWVVQSEQYMSSGWLRKHEGKLHRAERHFGAQWRQWITAWHRGQAKRRRA